MIEARPQSSPKILPIDQDRSASLDIGNLFQLHGPFLGRVIQRMCGPGDHVDDILQDSFITAYRRRESFAGRAQVRTWLYAIAANLCRRHQRSHRRQESFRARLAREHFAGLSNSCETPEKYYQRTERLALVHETLALLSFKQREVFTLYELEGMEGAAIAEVTGVSVGTVWTRLKAARKNFRRLVRRRLAKEKTE